MDARTLVSKPLDLTDEQSLQMILDSVPEGILVFDRSLRISYFNKTAENITGYLVDEVVGATYPEVFRVREEECALFRAFHGGDARFVWDELVETKSGAKIVIEANVSVLKGTDGSLVGGVALLRDVTKTREIEEMKNEFVSIVSHELRTPLASIGGYCDLMLIGATGDLSDEQKSYLNTIQRNSENLARLINDLLDLSKIESRKMEMSMSMVNVVNLVQEVADDFQPLVTQNGLLLSVESPGDLPNVYCDRDKIKQVLTNLMGNAIKFTKPGGRITVSVSEEPRNIRFSVEDSGIGIAKEKQSIIFDKFQQLENPLTREKEGSGLGLAIAKALVDRHNGRIWVESEAGKGCRFVFALPLKRTQVMAAQRQSGDLEFLRCWHHLKCGKKNCVLFEADEPACWAISEGNLCTESAPTFKEKLDICTSCEVFKNNMRVLQDSRGLILVLSDDVDQVSLVSGLLEREGYVCIRMHNPQHALELAGAITPDVIISDGDMRSMDGYGFLSFLKSSAATKEIPVIFLKDQRGDARKRRHSPIENAMSESDLLFKPVDRMHLLTRVENVLVRSKGKRERKRRGRRFVLVVDDTVNIFNLIRLYLDDRRFEVVHAKTGLDGVDLARQIFPDVMVIHTHIPSSDDYSIVKLIKEGEETRNIPVVFVSSLDDRSRAQSFGVDDFLIKPIKQRCFLSALSAICNKSFVESEKKILVLDPDADARGLVVSTLRRGGYDAEGLGNGKEALEWIADQEPDLIIMEINAPGLDGFDLAQRLRDDKDLSQIPVVVFTSRDLSSDEKELLKVGNTVYVSKSDFAEDRFLKGVRELL